MPTVAELISQAAQRQRAGDLTGARQLFEQVVQVDPRNFEVWHQLGLIAFQERRHADAKNALANAIRLEGSRTSFHHNYGTVCASDGDMASARTSYEQALRLEPTRIASRVFLWNTLRAIGRMDEAAECLPYLRYATPRTTEEHMARAMVLLALGELKEGFEEYEYRHQLPLHRELRATPQAKWDRSPLAGRTLLVYAEQGLGDTLQYARYFPRLAALGGTVVIAAQEALLPLLQASGIGPLAPQKAPWPPHDVELGICSLPWAFGTTQETIPRDVPYLRAKPELVDHWRQRLARVTGLRVGIAWQGNQQYLFDGLRSIPLRDFAPLARVEGTWLVSLQKGAGSEQLTGLAGAFPVADLSAEIDEAHGSFMDTAAIISNLDLVITSDTSIAHLAGALGAPVWMALSVWPEFRWQLDRADSPWYPTMRLFRQRQIGRWDEVFEQMATELAALAARRK